MPSKDTVRITLTGRVEIQYIDGDGSRCLQCGDMVFDRAGELVMKIWMVNGNKPLTEVRPLDGMFCQSCAQVLEERLEADKENNDGG